MTTPDANGWMPISEFSQLNDKTGRYLLRLSNGEIVTGSHFSALCEFWACGNQIFGAREPEFHSFKGEYCASAHPTHWQPLPKPPVSP